MEIYNPFTLEGKTILVAGVSSGIGKGAAIECSKMGASLILPPAIKNGIKDLYLN